MPVLNLYRFQCWHSTDVQYRASNNGLFPTKLPFGATSVVVCSYTSSIPALYQYHASTANPSVVLARFQDGCKQGAMPILDGFYRAEGWRGTGIVQSQS